MDQLHAGRQAQTALHPHRFAFIIGAMKSGTTSMFDILSQHPQICPSRVKEPDFFTGKSKYRNLEDYLSLWEWDDDRHRVALESSVSYTKAPFITGVPLRIQESSIGECRFIYMLRNPLRRIESQVRHGVFAGWGKSLDEELTSDLVEFSRYAMQLDEYRKVFSIEQICILTLEEFQENPHKVLKRLCRFLEVDEDFDFCNVNEPRNSGNFFDSSPLIAKVTQGKFSQFVAGRILPSSLKRHIRNIIAKLQRQENAQQKGGRWKLNAHEQSYILNELKDDLSRLRSVYNVDVKRYWNIPNDFTE